MAGGRTFKVIFDGDSSGAESAAGRVTGSLDKVESHASKVSGALGDIGKIATGVAVGGFITQAPGFLKDAAEAAIEDEASTARLNQTLQNYVDTAGDAGGGMQELKRHTDDLIGSGQKLGFTDDDIRDSFGGLLTATGDAGKATERLGAAQDLARAKQIPLTEASKLLGKVTDENLQVLKRMGITLPDVANEADVLAAIQKKFAGQADTYAKSTAGQFEQAKIAWSEAAEGIGYGLLPVITKVTAFLAEQLPTVQALAGEWGGKFADGVELVTDNIDKLEPAMSAAGEAGQTVYDIFGPLITDIFGELVDVAKEVGPVFRDDMVPALQEVEPVLKPLGILAGVVAAGPIYLLLQAVKFLTPWVGDYLVVAIKILSVEITAGMKVYGLMVGSIQAVIGIFQAAGGAATTFIGFIKDIPSKLGDVPGLLKQKGIDMVTGFFGGAKELWDDGTKGVASVVGFVKAIPEKVGDVTKLLWDKGLDVLDGLFGGVKWVWDSEVRGWKIIFGFVQDIPDKVGDVAKLLWDKGEDVMDGLFEGVSAVWDNEVRGFKVITSAVLSIPDKVGDVARLLWDKGGDIGSGFVDGIVDGASKVAGGMADITVAVKHGLHDALQSAFDWAHNNLSIGLPSFDTPFGSFGGGSLGFPYVSVPYFAAGVRDFAGGLAVVGERGPELVALPRGANVFSNAESRGMLSGGGVTQVVHIHGDWHASDDARGRITQGDLSYFLGRELRAIGMN